MEMAKKHMLNALKVAIPCQRFPIPYWFKAKVWRRNFKQGKVLIHNFPKACAFIPKRKYY